MGTHTGTVMTLANSIIGVSVLAMPFCFKQCGIALSILMLVCSSFVSRLACHFLLKAAIMARRRNFEFLAFHIFGLTGKFTAELFVIGFLMGTCIAFFVVMGDLGPAIVSKSLGINNTAALRPSVLIGLAVFVVLPLGLLRNVDSLVSVCTVTIGFYGCLVLKVISEALPHLVAGDWIDKVHFWRPAGIMQCIPIFSMALFCQTQLFEIYETLCNASLECMNGLIRAAVNMCTAVYICVGFFGYVAYCTQTFSGNIMMSFTPSPLSEMIKVGFVLSVAVSFPLVIFPCRASLYSLLFRRIGVPHHEVGSGHIPETRFKCLTVFIISVSLLVGLLIPNIELVLGLVGSTIGVLICVMFPAAAFICISSKSSYERLLAQVLLFIGALILVLGTYATLYAANEAALQAQVTSLKPVQLQNKLAVEIAQKVEALEEKAEAKVKMKDDLVELPATAGVRQEPPVPVEPGAPAKVVVQDPPAVIPKLVLQSVAPEQQVQEPDKKEEAKLVDQDAIRKEDEELAEAEKEAKDESEKKDAELLRKLEEHQEEQIKLLQEQKQILQALQEHKKEIERSKQANNQTAEKNIVVQGKADLPPQRLSHPEKASLSEHNIKQEKANIAKQQLADQERGNLAQQKLTDQKIVDLPEQKVVNPSGQRGADIQQQNVVGKQEGHIPGQSINGAEKAMVPNPPIIAKENVNISQQNIVTIDRGRIAEQKDNAQANQNNQVEGNLIRAEPKLPQQTFLGKQNANFAEQKEPQQKLENEAVAKPPLPNIQSKTKLEVFSNEITNQRKIVEGIVKKQDQMIVPKNSVGSLLEPKKIMQNAPKVVEQRKEQGPVPANFLMERLKSPLLVQNKPQDVAEEAKAMRRDILQQPVKDSLGVHDREKRDAEEENCVVTETADFIANEELKVKNTTVVEKEIPEQNISLIKTSKHLTDPKVESLVPQNLEETLQQGGLSQDSKPMKRDLKSVTSREDKDD